MKKCKRCGVIKEVTEFYRVIKSGDKLRASCKECLCKKNANGYYKNRERNLLYYRNYYEKNRKNKIKKNIDDNKKDKEKYKARYRLRNAIKIGTIQKKPCDICGNKKVDAHHYKGYNGDNWKEVKWLCVYHHHIEHRKYDEDTLKKEFLNNLKEKGL